MQENQNGNKWITIMVIVAIILILGACGNACSAESDYERDMRSGFDKWTSGDYGSMSGSEKDAVNDFLEWSNEH